MLQSAPEIPHEISRGSTTKLIHIYLSEVVYAEEIEVGQLNLVKAPTGSGKTTWALDTLAEEVTDKHRMVYLIDTVNGKEQLLQHESTTYYDRGWQEKINSGIVYFGEKNCFVFCHFVYSAPAALGIVVGISIGLWI